jgi:predicted ribosome quality control (RQC) complex YloA/Tae2 family protein
VTRGPRAARIRAFDHDPFLRITSMNDSGYRVHELDGFEILVGKSARDNDRLSLRVARPRDFWLHAHGFAGSHVVVRHPEGTGEVPRHVLERAAELAAWHSKARDARGKVSVHLCRASEISKPRGAPAGQVRLRSFQTLKVYPGE